MCVLSCVTLRHLLRIRSQSVRTPAAPSGLFVSSFSRVELSRDRPQTVRHMISFPALPLLLKIAPLRGTLFSRWPMENVFPS